MAQIFCGGGDENSRKHGEKTTIYFPLVPKGNYVGARELENSLKKLAPLYQIHYENVDPEKTVENLDPGKSEEKFVSENPIQTPEVQRNVNRVDIEKN